MTKCVFILHKGILYFLFLLLVFTPHVNSQEEQLRLLVVGDPFAVALRNLLPEIEADTGWDISLEIVGYDDVRELTLANARDFESSFDIVSFDVVWLGEYIQQDVLLPLTSHIDQSPELDVADFLEVAYSASIWDGVQYGLPIQPHPELLWYRVDLFEENGLQPPVTTSDVIDAAQRLHQPEENIAGICWNAQQGQALAQQISHFYGAFGQPLIENRTQPIVNGSSGIEAADYARQLVSVSPTDILNMAWDQRITRFARGECAMTYAWGARFNMLQEMNPEIVDHIGFVSAPYAEDAAPVTPIGVWSLGIPANIGEHEDAAWALLAYLSSGVTQQNLALAGNGGFPRLSLLENDAIVEMYPMFPLIAELDSRDELQTWMRPSIAEWDAMADVIGTVFHRMLEGEISPEVAVSIVQDELEEILPDS